MDSEEVYNRVLIDRCFNEMKAMRNAWNRNADNKHGLATIIDISGTDYRALRFIMDKCNSIITEMIPFVFKELLKVYEISARWYRIQRNSAHIYSIKDNEWWPDYTKQSERVNIYAFSCDDNRYKDALFVFKEYGINNQLPKTLIEALLSDFELKGYGYVSIVEDEAYSEILNHNDDKKDVTRGTGILSLKVLFDMFFGEGEYSKFKEYANRFTEKVKNYFGFGIVRTLRPNTLHNFKRDIKNDLLRFDITEIGCGRKLADDQKTIINNQFFGGATYELMLGVGDYAQSYMTSEWLFTSLKEAGNIDLTSIAMGYMKSIEQLFFSYICLHSKEKDGRNRRIYSTKEGLLELTDSLVLNIDRSKYITLSSLSGFFGFFDNDTKKYIYRNSDLLIPGVTKTTHELIIDVFNGVSSLRNGYFHRHNLLEWDKVIEARNNARLVMFLLLGAYKISEDDKNALGLIRVEEHDDFYKLCKYLNNKAYDNGLLDIPIFYLNGQDKEYGFWFVHEDSYIEYDNYGEPSFSGIYFREPSDREHTRIRKADKNNHPSEIWEGILRISSSMPIEFKPSGPIKRIYKDGVYFGDES